MYSTCLFCNASLGANETLEHFPVGRRLAYDSATGRLWVVCKKCARWNLSPLETRWEAIEEAERLFRATKTRVATDNIGLAKLQDGTELVRVGKPAEVELAVWRYGDQFRKRHRKFLLNSALVTGAFAIPAAIVSGLDSAVFLGGLFSSTGSILQTTLTRRYDNWRHRVVPVAAVRDAQSNLLRVTQDNINAATLTRADDSNWHIALPHVTVKSAGKFTRFIGSRIETATVNEPVILQGATAMQALGTLLPAANRFGATNKVIKGATDVIQQSTSLDSLLRRASKESVYRANRFAIKSYANQIAYAPEEVRLALEMSLHADDERRATEGELNELEQRWRDADAIAKIADAMFLPESVEANLQLLHEQNFGKHDAELMRAKSRNSGVPFAGSPNAEQFHEQD